MNSYCKGPKTWCVWTWRNSEELPMMYVRVYEGEMRLVRACGPLWATGGLRCWCKGTKPLSFIGVFPVAGVVSVMKCTEITAPRVTSHRNLLRQYPSSWTKKPSHDDLGALPVRSLWDSYQLLFMPEGCIALLGGGLNQFLEHYEDMWSAHPNWPEIGCSDHLLDSHHLTLEDLPCCLQTN